LGANIIKSTNAKGKNKPDSVLKIPVRSLIFSKKNVDILTCNASAKIEIQGGESTKIIRIDYIHR
jgi:hypothetical protein